MLTLNGRFIAAGVFSVLSLIGIAYGDEPAKAKPSPKPTVRPMGAAHKAELAVTLAKRRASNKIKNARAASITAREAADRQAAYEQEVRLAPYRAAAASECFASNK